MTFPELASIFVMQTHDLESFDRGVMTTQSSPLYSGVAMRRVDWNSDSLEAVPAFTRMSSVSGLSS